jgi:hypothetical protein
MFKFNLKLQREIASDDSTAPPILEELTDEAGTLPSLKDLMGISGVGVEFTKTDSGDLNIRITGDAKFRINKER